MHFETSAELTADQRKLKSLLDHLASTLDIKKVNANNYKSDPDLRCSWLGLKKKKK